MSAKNINDIDFDSQKNHWREIFAQLEERERQECSDVYESLIFWQCELAKFNSELDATLLQASGQVLKEFGVDRELFLDDLISNKIKTLERFKEQLEGSNNVPIGHTPVAHYISFLHSIGIIEPLKKLTNTNSEAAKLIRFLGNYPESSFQNIRNSITDLRENNKRFFNATNKAKVEELIRKYTNLGK